MANERANTAELLRSLRERPRTPEPSSPKISRRNLLLLAGGLVGITAGVGFLATRPKDTPELTEKEQTTQAIREYEKRAGSSPVTKEMAESFVPLVVKLYSQTFPFPQAEEALQKLTIETRSYEEILSASQGPEGIPISNEDPIDRLYLIVHLPSINEPNDRFSKQYRQMDPLTVENIKPITNLRAELLHNLISWQTAQSPEREILDPTFLDAFLDVDTAREDPFTKSIMQALGTPGIPSRAVVKNQGFSMDYTFYDDLDRPLQDGGSWALEREIYGYLCQKIAVDNGLTFAQVSYDFEPDEFLALRGIIEDKAGLKDPELFGMIINSEIPGFINRINQAQTGVKFTSQAEMLNYWLGGFHDEMDRTELWVKLTHAFPGTKTPRLVFAGYK